MTCAATHPIWSRDGSFVPELESLANHATDSALRCKLCGRMFWAVCDTGKFDYQNSWELEPNLASAALIARDPVALARMFISMNLPYGPLWEMTSALVEIFRALTPNATDGERAHALETVGANARWATPIRIFTASAKQHPAPALQFPIDLNVANAGFREWHEVGHTLLVLNERSEMFRLEPRGLVHVPLAAEPIHVATGRRAIILEVGGAHLVIDDEGTATTWPRSDHRVTPLEEGWWLFVPNIGDEDRFIELHLPNGRPHVKLRRRFERDNHFMPPPRRVEGGWLISNVVADDGEVQAIALFGDDFSMLATSGKLPGDRAMRPVDRNTFYASLDDKLEVWTRNGDALVRTKSFDVRSSWVTGDLLVTDELDGSLTGRSLDGTQKWTWRRAITGASYGVATPGGVLVYDDTRAHLIDERGTVKKSFEVESPSVLAGNGGTVYLRSLAELWIIREDARVINVSTDMELESTSGDDAILRHGKGMYIVASKDGFRGEFNAKSASFSVSGTRGGPWVVEPERIRGAFEHSVRMLADAIALAIGGGVRTLPMGGEDPRAFAIFVPSGRAPILVQRYASGSITVCAFPKKTWHPSPGDSFADLARDVAAWVSAHPVTRPTMVEIAYHVASIVSGALNVPLVLSISGNVEPSEMWLRGKAEEIGIFDDRVVISGKRIHVGGDVEALREEVIAAVRAQQKETARASELGERMQVFGSELASRLSIRLSRNCVLTRTFVRYHDDASVDLVSLSIDGDIIKAHAGAPGARGWEGPATSVDAILEPVIAAIRVQESTLTIDRIKPGSRYKVIQGIGELVFGTFVTFKYFDDVDNHYGRYIFATDDGQEVAVSGDFSSSHSPLAEAYRFLEEARGEAGGAVR